LRKLLPSLLAAFLVGLTAVVIGTVSPVQASPEELYSPAAPYFGAGNFPPGCENDELVGSQLDRGGVAENNVCHHMRTGLNALDSPQVDVLVVVPVSPTAERDMRIMRQSVEMWEGGIDYLAEQMGLTWLSEGMDFHITVDYFDPTGDNGGEFTTYPIVDPEIVVIATNPVGGAGIGIDPFSDTPQNRCNAYPVGNPLDLAAWEALPGFNSHHEERPSGTYVEDCSATGGGNTCFAINGAIDPAPEQIDFFNLFDLVSHEFGHCLTLGHVGDATLEGFWANTPTNDIMAYSSDPPGLNKCVSTLDVEGVALRMSKYLDTNGDGVPGQPNDLLVANDQIGEGSNKFQLQHPDDHLYASGTGAVGGCPQPDLGPIPGPPTDWTPTPVSSTTPTMTITGPPDGSVSDTGIFEVTGTVERTPIDPDPIPSSARVDDSDTDATTPFTELLHVDVAVTDTHLDATLNLSEVWPSTQVLSPTSYTLVIDGRQFDSFIRYAVDPNPMTWDNGDADTPGKYMPAGSSQWDLTAKTVRFHIPLAHLAAEGIDSPYLVAAKTNVGVLTNAVVDDSAPDGAGTVPVASGSSASVGARLPQLPAADRAETVTFENPDGNTFYPEQSTLGVDPLGTSHSFNLDVPQQSDIKFALSWTDAVGGADLDLYVTGAADSGTTGATINAPETVTLENVKGALGLKVEPYFVTDPISGSTYTLTATITPDEIILVDTDLDGIFDSEDVCPNDPGISPTGCPDADGDGVADVDDVCPNEAGESANGCPIRPTEFVKLWVGGGLAATQAVDTREGPDTFVLPVALAEGTFEVRVDWESKGRVLTSQTLTLTHDSDDDNDGVPNEADLCPGHDDFDDTDRDGVPDGCDTDSDGDGTADHRDNCPSLANSDQSNLDGDAFGDACDDDIDGDRHSNGKEKAHGTDPYDATSYPGKPKKGALGV
jgi:hypothetical protein